MYLNMYTVLDKIIKVILHTYTSGSVYVVHVTVHIHKAYFKFITSRQNFKLCLLDRTVGFVFHYYVMGWATHCEVAVISLILAMIVRRNI